MSFVNMISKIDAEVERINGYIQRLYGASEGQSGNAPMVQSRILYSQLSPLMDLLEQFYSQLPDAGIQFNRQQVESFFVDDESGAMPEENIQQVMAYLSGLSSSADMDLVNSVYKNRQNNQRTKNLPKGSPAGPGPAGNQASPAGLAPGTEGQTGPINV